MSKLMNGHWKFIALTAAFFIGIDWLLHFPQKLFPVWFQLLLPFIAGFRPCMTIVGRGYEFLGLVICIGAAGIIYLASVFLFSLFPTDGYHEPITPPAALQTATFSAGPRQGEVANSKLSYLSIGIGVSSLLVFFLPFLIVPVRSNDGMGVGLLLMLALCSFFSFILNCAGMICASLVIDQKESINKKAAIVGFVLNSVVVILPVAYIFGSVIIPGLGK